MRASVRAALTPVILLGVVGALVGTLAGCRREEPGATDASSAALGGGPQTSPTLYYCPMHPTMVSDHPGDCPICSMRMVPMEEGRPGVDSMGMQMVPVEVEEGSARGGVEGYTALTIPIQKQQLIGVRIGPVKRSPFSRAVRAVGRVTADETRLHHIHTKIGGWVERLYVDTTGEKVEKGDTLLTIYSPELLATQEEYLLALRSRRTGAETVLPEVAKLEGSLLESARRRLQLFDLTPEQIERLEKTGEATRTVALFAPAGGYVMKRLVSHGERIGPDMTLLEIADLSRVWVLASVYEYELPFVKVGQEAATTLSYFPGRTYRGRVVYIYPVLDAATRTVQVRLEVQNPGLELKPEMYAQVTLEGDLGERLVVPDSAVLASGEREIVFVSKGDGYFEPRLVRTGLRSVDTVEILEGLSEGEQVVISGNFFVDSESKLKAALEAAASAAAPASGSAQPAPGEHRH